MNVTITFTSVGSNVAGPFTLYSDRDPYPGGSPVASSVPLSEFLPENNGYAVEVPEGTLAVRCIAENSCGDITVYCTPCETQLVPYASWNAENGGEIQYGCDFSNTGIDADQNYDLEISFSVNGGALQTYTITVFSGTNYAGGTLPSETEVDIDMVALHLIGPVGDMLYESGPFVCQDTEYIPTTTTTSTWGAFDLYQVCVGIDNVRSGDYVYTCYNPMWMWMRHTSSILGVGAQLFDDEEMTTYTKGAGYIQQSSSSVIFTISSGGFVDIETEYGCSGPAVSCAPLPTTTTTSTTSEPICTQVLDNSETLFGYSASSAYDACQAEGTVTLYGDNAAFTSATHIYSDSSCETNALAGYYSGKGYNYVRLWTGTSFEGDDIYCPTLTTTTTTIS